MIRGTILFYLQPLGSSACCLSQSAGSSTFSVHISWWANLRFRAVTRSILSCKSSCHRVSSECNGLPNTALTNVLKACFWIPPVASCNQIRPSLSSKACRTLSKPAREVLQSNHALVVLQGLRNLIKSCCWTAPLLSLNQILL